MLNLSHLGGSLFDASAVDQSSLSAQQLCGHCAVHGNVAAADDDDLLAGIVSTAGGTGCLQEINSGHNACLISTGDLGQLCLPQACADEDSGIFLLQLLNLDVLAHLGVEDKLHAQVLDLLDVVIDNVLGQSGGSDAIGQHAAGLGLCFVDSDFIAFLGQHGCAGQRSGACADAGDLGGLLLGGSDQGLHAQSLLLLDGIALQLADLDGSVDAAAAAGALAQSVVGADIGAGAAHRVVLTDGLSGALHVAEADGTDELGGISTGGASLAAGCVMAQQAACGLFHCGAGSETSNSFGKIGGFHYFTQVAQLLSCPVFLL